MYHRTRLLLATNIMDDADVTITITDVTWIMYQCHILQVKYISYGTNMLTDFLYDYYIIYILQ